MRKVLLIGAGGMLAREIADLTPEGTALEALDHERLDITDADALGTACRSLRPDVVINASAYTRVDDAETEKEAAERTNHHALAALGDYARAQGFRVVHFSTDYVFDGEGGRPYRTDDPTNPINVYGRTKRNGECAVAERAKSYAIVRTSWLYSKYGSNFVKTILKALTEREELQVVDDQVGRPTWAQGLAKVAWRLAERSDLDGIFHWADAGVASRYDLAQAVHDNARRLGLSCQTTSVQPTTTDTFSRPAPRPGYSILETHTTSAALGICTKDWRGQLAQMMDEMGAQRMSGL